MITRFVRNFNFVITQKSATELLVSFKGEQDNETLLSVEDLQHSQFELMLQGKPSSYQILQSDTDLIAYRHPKPCAEKHFCVISRQVVNSFDQLDPQAAGKIMLACKKLADAMGMPTGYRVVTN